MSLESSISSILSKASGTFGVAAWNVADERSLFLNEHEVFPSASVIKLPMLVELFCRRDEGRLSFDEVVTLKAADKAGGSGVLSDMHEGLGVTMRDLAVLMIILSDNTATNIIIDRIGFEGVNERMRLLGLRNTILGRKMYDWERQKLGNENYTSPHDMMLLLRLILDGRISGTNACREMIDIMARQHYRERIPHLLPEGLKIANKTGSIKGVAHDVAIVFAEKGPYILCVMAKELADSRTGDRTIADVSKAVYDLFCA